MKVIDGDHLKSILQEYVKREEAYAEFFDSLSAQYIAAGLLEAIHSIEEEPPVQPEINKEELKQTIRAGIVATNTEDVYSCGMRNGMRWCKALLEDDEPKFEDASLYAQPETCAYWDSESNFCALHRPSVQPEQRWIPCSERLPIDAGHYLCSFEKPNRIDRIHVDLAYWTGSRWYGYMADAICAWMPLPTPWKGEEDE